MTNIETYNSLSFPSFPPYSDFGKWVEDQMSELLNTPAIESSIKNLEAKIISALQYYKTTRDIQNENIFVKYVLIGNDLELSICGISSQQLVDAEEILRYGGGLTNITAEEIFFWTHNKGALD